MEGGNLPSTDNLRPHGTSSQRVIVMATWKHKRRPCKRVRTCVTYILIGKVGSVLLLNEVRGKGTHQHAGRRAGKGREGGRLCAATMMLSCSQYVELVACGFASMMTAPCCSASACRGDAAQLQPIRTSEHGLDDSGFRLQACILASARYPTKLIHTRHTS